jgi:hypothetical protein
MYDITWETCRRRRRGRCIFRCVSFRINLGLEPRPGAFLSCLFLIGGGCLFSDRRLHHDRLVCTDYLPFQQDRAATNNTKINSPSLAGGAMFSPYDAIQFFVLNTNTRGRHDRQGKCVWKIDGDRCRRFVFISKFAFLIVGGRVQRETPCIRENPVRRERIRRQSDIFVIGTSETFYEFQVNFRHRKERKGGKLDEC